jgi:hypothetical protein
MRFHPTVRMRRALLSAAAFLALLPSAPLQGQQRIIFAGLPWGLPADSVRPRLEALGWRFIRTAEHGDPVFQRDSVRAQAVIANGRLVQVNAVHPTRAANRQARLRFLVDSLPSLYGPPSNTTEDGSAWEGNLSSLAVTRAVAGQSAVMVVYLSAAAEHELNRRAGTRDPYPALTGGWIELARTSDRRMAVDTGTIAAVGQGVYRARVRFDRLEPQIGAGKRYDAIMYMGDHDCTGRRMIARGLALYFQGQLVEEVGDSRWRPIDSANNEDLQMDLVCAIAAEYLGIPPTTP